MTQHFKPSANRWYLYVIPCMLAGFGILVVAGLLLGDTSSTTELFTP